VFRIEAHYAQTKIEVRMFTLDRQRVEAVRKAVSASRYASTGHNGEARGGYTRFMYPLTVDKCNEMRDAWGSDLKVAKPLADWYRQAKKVRQAQVARATQTDAELPLVATRYPELNAWLKPDQRVTAAWIREAYRDGGLLADEVGTGKTAGVVAGLIERDVQGSALVVCPKISVKAVWLKELTQHTDVPVYACTGNRAARERKLAAFLADPSPFKVLVVVAEMLRIKAVRSRGRVEEFLGYEYPDIIDHEWSAAVVDESHKLLGAMDVVRANLAGEGLRDLRLAPGALRLAVTATPFGKGGRVQAIFGTMHWLYPDEFTSRWAWLGKYWEVSDEKVFVRGGGGTTKMVKRIGELHSEDKLWEDLGPRVLRRRMEDVSPEHRGLKNYIEMAVELDGPQAAQYRKFAENGELPVDGGIVSTVGVLDFITRCRQFANGVLRMRGGRVEYTGVSAKVDRLVAHLDTLEPNRKVVVASQYNEFLDMVEARLENEGYRLLRLDGRTSEVRRAAIMKEFQEGTEHTVFLLNGKAGGVSITLDAAEELHSLDEMDPDAMTQLFGRIFRRGRVHEVFYYMYRAIGTIDEKLGHNVAGAHAEQAKLLDGRMGKEYAYNLAKYNPEGK
jgi:SNF2 family DNA or RNA helicase